LFDKNKQSPMTYSFLNRILNVSQKEWPRILLAWTLHIFLRTGFVIGWTITIATFVNRIGVELLPYLFVLNALMIMLGSLIYSNLLKRVSKATLILGTTLTAGALLFLGALFTYGNPIPFFGLIIAAQSILLSQLNILISLFTEELFTPLESERAFPLIATAETLGGIIGGITISTLAWTLPAYKFLYIWVILLLCIIPVLLTSQRCLSKLPAIHLKKEKPDQDASEPIHLKSITNTLRKAHKIPFLRGIILVIGMQLMLFTLLEFQYTKAIQDLVINQSETLLNSYAMQGQTLSTNEIHHIVESKIVEKLGVLQILFSTGSLLVQIFLASRIIKSLGIVGSMIIHPIVTILHMTSMLINFNFVSTAITKSSFEITGGIFKNAYHSSYYTLSESLRESMKELLEGFVKPAGVILAFAYIFVIQHSFATPQQTWALNFVMVVISACMIARSIPLQNEYTALSEKNLSPEKSLSVRLNAIEILAQKGHKNSIKALLHYLRLPEENEKIKIKIIESLKGNRQIEVISQWVNCLQSKSECIQISALEALNQTRNLEKILKEKVFAQHRLTQLTQDLFQESTSSTIRTECIQLLSKIDGKATIPFLLNTLENSSNVIKRACIKACSTTEDINVWHYLAPYLEDKDPMVKAETIEALWKFPSLRPQLQQLKENMLKAKAPHDIIANLKLLGSIGSKKDLPYLIKHLGSTKQTIRHAAAKALCQLNHPASIPHMAEFIMHNNKTIVSKTKRFLKRVDKSMVESIEQLVHIRISDYILNLLSEHKEKYLNELPKETLERLQMAYATVDEYNEVAKIEKILKAQTSSPQDEDHLTLPQHALAS
jgi:HEAT repeat protein